ncbi:hypothetical protein L873DRAFT_238004 [Choiromyces venosus 120613-1]|uniref:Uncharacterized protein n=1 Tax=Choiromyces venosus 120613-1 TaxID=1336337 RepID=A0A3N4JZC3_9PEZI|nr:hypothetical protein L873DRAFT_238004 [Choiromyces venosus 120613-1]
MLNQNIEITALVTSTSTAAGVVLAVVLVVKRHVHMYRGMGDRRRCQYQQQLYIPVEYTFNLNNLSET